MPQAGVPVQHPCADWDLFFFDGEATVQSLFERSDFAVLDKLYDQWSTGVDRYPDGTWKLRRFDVGLNNWFKARGQQVDLLAKIRLWQSQQPGSFAARLAEVLYWRDQAWRVRGNGMAGSVTREAWQLFRERLSKADALLEQIRDRASQYPGWYPLKISTMLERGEDLSRIEAVFADGVKRFPQYHQIYFEMARVLEPKWGGSEETLDGFANWAAAYTKSFEGAAMYSRIYWATDCDCVISYEQPGRRYPDSHKLIHGYETLVSTYPNSLFIVSQFASVACRTSDSMTYRALRTELARNHVHASFRPVSVEACDLRHRWEPPPDPN